MQETELNVKRVIIDTTFNHNLWKEGYKRINPISKLEFLKLDLQLPQSLV